MKIDLSEKRIGKLRDRVVQFLYDIRYGTENTRDLDELADIARTLLAENESLKASYDDLRTITDEIGAENESIKKHIKHAICQPPTRMIVLLCALLDNTDAP